MRKSSRNIKLIKSIGNNDSENQVSINFQKV